MLPVLQAIRFCPKNKESFTNHARKAMSAVAAKFVMTDSKDVNSPQISPLNVSPTRLSGAVGPIAA